MAEPMTVATDYLLAIAAIVFGVRLWRAGARMWAVAFFATAAAAILGGTYHGWPALPLWKPAVYAVGIASLFLLAGLGRAFLLLAIVKFTVYAAWMAVHDDFRYVIYDYGLTLAILAIYAIAKIRDAGSRWVLASIGVSVIAAAVQQSGFAIHRHFNHNDLYHLMQIAALWLLYRGGVRRMSRPR
ncbi:MAG TPA: hypothetical protein VM779_07715 [Thermoanaerobaculia bacterium]|nr:hypothetical protein [Thermoanaerobaculia bacterium]